MSGRVSQFLGGSPLGVFVRLVILSIVVGIVLSWLSWSPRELLDWIGAIFNWLWYSVFGSLERAVDYFLLGAAIVVPIFLISRLVKWTRR